MTTQRYPSMGKTHAIKVETSVPTKMRDGVTLYADIIRPEGSGKYPVLLQRTPYDRAGSLVGRSSALMGDMINMATHGYAVVIQDCRGRFESEGDWRPFFSEVDDGYDTVEWCAAQPWSTGKVGMYGGSYLGATQWLAAIAKPPSLVALFPSITSDGYYDNWTYQGGALGWLMALSWGGLIAAQNLEHTLRNKEIPQAMVSKLVQALEQLQKSYSSTPPKDVPGMSREIAPYFHEWLEHPTYDDYWKKISIVDRHNQITVPAYNVGGWFDIFARGTLSNFSGVRAKGATPKARQGRLLMGPWAHTGQLSGLTGDYYFGSAGAAATVDLLGQQMRWFDYWLKGEQNGIDKEPPVKIFIMGENVWRTENEWPLARAQETKFFLHSSGRANTLNGDGMLSRDANGASESPDAFLYDPRNPVPTKGGELCCDLLFFPGGSYDQRAIEARPDVLCYTTPPLAEDTEVTGPMTVTLYAATSAPDTDFTAKLVDVCPAPDHCVHSLVDGIIRARYRNGTGRAAPPLKSGQVEKYVIELGATSNLFKKGHSIRVEISSSNFPRFDRNPNTGEEPWKAAELRTATQMVFHTAEHPSHITLPIIPRK
ncbi:MAG: CocE/NonD family hydrolase [Dehalococcoidia bacterium]|nr:CocE/NonD family hydrolase [Dehalococcoidia bacterium]